MGYAVDGNLLDDEALAQAAEKGGLGSNNSTHKGSACQRAMARMSISTASKPPVSATKVGTVTPSAEGAQKRGSLFQAPPKISSRDNPLLPAKPQMRHVAQVLPEATAAEDERASTDLEIGSLVANMVADGVRTGSTRPQGAKGARRGSWCGRCSIAGCRSSASGAGVGLDSVSVSASPPSAQLPQTHNVSGKWCGSMASPVAGEGERNGRLDTDSPPVRRMSISAISGAPRKKSLRGGDEGAEGTDAKAGVGIISLAHLGFSSPPA